MRIEAGFRRLPAGLVVATLLVGLAGRAHAFPDEPPRRPVAPPVTNAHKHPSAHPEAAQDAVVARIHSLLAGVPLRSAGIDVVPLFARRPSEASSAPPDVPVWRSAELKAEKAAPGVVRLRHAGRRAVLVIPGLFVRAGAFEYQIRRADLVTTGASLYAPMREIRVAPLQKSDRESGIVGSREAGSSLLGDDTPTYAGTAAMRGTRRVHSYRQLNSDAFRWFGSDSDRSLVGCVFLVGGDPVSAYAFASHDLFRAAWPELLATAVVAQRLAIAGGMPPSQLAKRAARGSPRGRAVWLLRRIAAEPARTREVPGGGLRWESGGRELGYVGHALTHGDGRVLFAGVFLAPRDPKAKPNAPQKPSSPPGDGEEDPTKRRGGRFNPFRNGLRETLVPPR